MKGNSFDFSQSVSYHAGAFPPGAIDYAQVMEPLLRATDSLARFDQMLKAVWAAVAPGGFLFIRLASNIGIESKVQPIGNGRYLLPDGSERFLVDEAMLLGYQNEFGMKQLELIKTTNVQGLRCMTTWCVGKGNDSSFASK